MIVPQLGGFIAQDVPARYIAEKNLFLPPHRTVGFNPQLTLNDGLLVQSYMQAYDTNYPETLKLIEQAVTSLKEELQHHGEFKLNGIGKLALNIDGLYNFIPNEAGILSPELYGLDAVTLKLNDEKSNKTGDSEENLVCAKQHSTKNYTFSINKEFVNYVAAAVVAIFFYFVWATPITDSTTITARQASLLFPHSIQHLQESIPEFVPVESDTLLATLESANKDTQCETKDTTFELHNDYAIVLISSIPLTNAEAFVQELKDKGIQNVSILNKRNMIRVVYGAYPSEGEAYTDLVKLRKQDSIFKEAWILHIK